MNEHVALVELQEKVRVEELEISEEVLKFHRMAPATKGEGIIHLIYEMQTDSAIGSVTMKKSKKQRRFITSLMLTLLPTASTGST